MSKAPKLLASILAEDRPEAHALRKRFDRSQLWRYRQGERVPDLRTAVEIERLTNGEIPASSWICAA
jgi:hypothetical protein